MSWRREQIRKDAKRCEIFISEQKVTEATKEGGASHERKDVGDRIRRRSERRRCCREKKYWCKLVRITERETQRTRKSLARCNLKASIRNYPKLAAITRKQVQLPETDFRPVSGFFLSRSHRMWLELRVAKKILNLGWVRLALDGLGWLRKGSDWVYGDPRQGRLRE
jgi:hypothetical protein